MKKLSLIQKKQHSFITDRIKRANDFLETIPKTELEAILLSGSVARGDYYPGKFGGMTDLTIMKKEESRLTVEMMFGKNEEPAIPYHCIKRNGEWYSIAFHSFIDANTFQKFEESKKFALLESRVLWDNNNRYIKELEKIKKLARAEQRKALESSLGYIRYLLSEYKKDRWQRREAFSQLHANLDTSIQIGINCLYYVNGKYAAPQDRRLYYSYELEKLPDNYEKIIEALSKQDIYSETDYKRRETLFLNSIYKYCESVD
jgi:hypothetical protein